MKQANCSLTPEGYPIIFFTALGTLAFAMLGCSVMTVIFLVLCWFSLNFFRDPERVVPAEANVAVSPADGKVVFKNETALAAQQYFTEKANQGIWNIPNKVNQSYGSALMNNLEAFISIGSTAGVNNNASPKYELNVFLFSRALQQEPITLLIK